MPQLLSAKQLNIKEVVRELRELQEGVKRIKERSGPEDIFLASALTDVQVAGQKQDQLIATLKSTHDYFNGSDTKEGKAPREGLDNSQENMLKLLYAFISKFDAASVKLHSSRRRRRKT